MIRISLIFYLCCIFRAPIGQGYGLTETFAGAAFSEWDDTTVGRVGPPVPCCYIKVYHLVSFQENQPNLTIRSIKFWLSNYQSKKFKLICNGTNYVSQANGNKQFILTCSKPRYFSSKPRYFSSKQIQSALYMQNN